MTDEASLAFWPHEREVELFHPVVIEVFRDCVTMWKHPTVSTDSSALEEWIALCTNRHLHILEPAAKALARRARDGTYSMSRALALIAQILDVPRGLRNFNPYGPVSSVEQVLEAAEWPILDPPPQWLCEIGKVF